MLAPVLAGRGEQNDSVGQTLHRHHTDRVAADGRPEQDCVHLLAPVLARRGEQNASVQLVGQTLHRHHTDRFAADSRPVQGCVHLLAPVLARRGLLLSLCAAAVCIVKGTPVRSCEHVFVPVLARRDEQLLLFRSIVQLVCKHAEEGSLLQSCIYQYVGEENVIQDFLCSLLLTCTCSRYAAKTKCLERHAGKGRPQQRLCNCITLHFGKRRSSSKRC